MGSPSEELLKRFDSLSRDLGLAKTSYEKGRIRESMREVVKELKDSPIGKVDVTNTQSTKKVVFCEDAAGGGGRDRSVFVIKGAGQLGDLDQTGECERVEIDGIEDRSVENIIQTRTSFTLRNSRNCRLKVVAQQVRLINCRHIMLEACTRTGVFLEESEDISVKALEGITGKAWKNDLSVHDFSGAIEIS